MLWGEWGQGRPRSLVHLGGNQGPCKGLSTEEQTGSPALQNILTLDNRAWIPISCARAEL